MSRKRERTAFIVIMIATFFEGMVLWLQFDRTMFGRGGAGLDFIRDSFEMGPGDVVIRLQAGFALSLIFGLGCLLDVKAPPEE